MRGVELGDLSPTDCTAELRLIPNSSLEWAFRRDSSRHTLLVPFVACAVGATASAAVVLALVDATTQTSVPPISVRAIVRDASAFQGTTTAQNRLVVETPMQLAPTGTASALDEPVTQKEEDHPSEVHGRQLRKHSRVVVHSREPYWQRRFTRTRSQRFSLW